MNNFVALDFETTYFPKRNVGLQTMGVDQYLHHPDTEIYLVSIHSEEGSYVGHPDDFDWASIADGRLWVSHNAAFDKRVWRRYVELHPNMRKFSPISWNCSSNLACWIGAPRSLKDACNALFNVDVSKDARKFMENKTYRELKASSEWPAILEYAERDAYWCWRIWNEFSDKWPQIEKEISLMTIAQCMRGLPTSIDYLGESVQTLERVCWEVEKNLPWRQGKKSDKSVLSPLAVAEECRKLGIRPPTSLAEDSIACQKWELANPNITWISDMRRYRKSNLLLTKMRTMLERVRPDGRIDFSQKYCGAHTKRTSGDQGFNIQGFQRDTLEGVDMRKAIQSMKGGKLIIADLAQIEPRVLSWVTEDTQKMSLINQGISVYQAHAMQALGWKGENLKKEDPSKYNMCKMRVLGLSYGCGPEKFANYCWLMYGHKLSLKDAKLEVRDFRSKEKHVVAFWDLIQARLEDSLGSDLEIELPSWNTLTYKHVYRDSQGQIRGTLATGRENRLWGSLIVENIIQSIARDCFYEKVLELEKEGLPTLFTVHDEVITDEVPADMEKDATDYVAEVMSRECSWMPGIKLDSEYVTSPFYLK